MVVVGSDGFFSGREDLVCDRGEYLERSWRHSLPSGRISLELWSSRRLDRGIPSDMQM